MKKVNWEKTFKPFKRNLGGNYSSGKDLLKSAFQRTKEQEEIMDTLQKALPTMRQLLLIRLQNRTPLKVMRPLQYKTQELQKSRNNAKYVDTVKVLNPGEELIFEAYNSQLQEFIFKSSNGEEIAINVVDQQQLLTQTDIYEVVSNYNDSETE